MSRYLFIFTIGPVQSFIGQARKTQDLYAGSFLLSYIIDSAMKELENKVNNCEFIFPHKDIKSKPNRFIAEIESDDVEKVGKELKCFVTDILESICAGILGDLNLNPPGPNDFNAQIRDFFQVNWVALPLKRGNYVGDYQELESLLGSIKNVRTFKQLNNGNGEIGCKCSLCGERNVLFYRNKKRAYVNGCAISLDAQPSMYMNDREGLCAICFAKRFADKYQDDNYKYNKNYPSTVKIALMDLLAKSDIHLLEEYRNIFGNGFDEELYYRDNLTKQYFKKNNYPMDRLEDAKAYLKKVSEKAIENKVEFSKYYAILMLDGDSMGKWLFGEFLENKTELKEFHKQLSKKLGDYAGSAEKIIQNPKGKIVYSGGDDVLAFINLNQLLPTMEKLRIEFGEFTNLKCKIKPDKKFSASCGVAIAHYKMPMAEVLKWARKMEHEAKSMALDKDAFAISVLKRTGGISKTMFKWQYGNLSVIKILEKLIESLKNDFSNTFILSLGLEFARLMDSDGKYGNKTLVKAEIKRLVGRSCMIRKNQNETIDDLQERKTNAINELSENLSTLYINSKSLDNFLSALSITEFIERGGVI